MSETDTEEKLRRARAALSAYGDGMRQLARVAQEIAEPIKSRMKPAEPRSPASAADLAVIDALTKIVETVETTAREVGKALDE